MDRASLTNWAIFQELPVEVLDLLIGILEPVEVLPGEELIREGERGDSFFLIDEGEVEVIKARRTPAERSLGSRFAGDFLGEMSLLNPDGLRTSTIVARTKTHLWKMDRLDFVGLIKHEPMLGYRMLSVLSQRLNNADNETIRDLEEKNRQLLHAYEELKSAQAQLIEKEKLEHELRLAYEIQMSFLPQKMPRLNGFDFGAAIVPARAVGGDLFDFIPLAKEQVGIVVGDVTDKGVPAAIFMAQAHALLRAEAGKMVSPKKTLQRVNHLLRETHGNQLFVTVLYGILEQITGKFTFARAGHEAPFYLNSRGEYTRVPTHPSQPLGILPSPLIDEQTLILEPGSMLALITDGVLDERDPEGDDFGVDRLGRTLSRLQGKSAQTICDEILRSISQHQRGAPQDDDITLVITCRNEMS